MKSDVAPSRGQALRTLIIDNYDSFTFNLFQMIAEVNDAEPVVVRNDAAWNSIDLGAFDNIVLSPGPGRPERRADFGICEEAIRFARVPVLGVCLGHQGLGHTFGATVAHAPTAMHGRTSEVFHNGDDPLLVDIPNPFRVVRYHSLMVAGVLPSCLKPIAWTEDGILMGMRHRTLPFWGVQFHPESICTEFGYELLENFTAITRAWAHGLGDVPPSQRAAQRSAEVA